MAGIDLPDFDRMPKHRRDWLEVFGNQWGTRHFEPSETVLTDEERESLERSLNPFHSSVTA